jgi:hypothetical protein
MRSFALAIVPAVALMATVLMQPAEGQLFTGWFAIAGIATLAIVKEKLIASGISRNAAFNGNTFGKRKREALEVATQSVNFGPLFDAIAKSDSADCGKMLVCTIMAKPVEKRSVDEQRVALLFDDLEHIDASSAYANYQLAALVGTLHRPDLCAERYARCPASGKELQEVLSVHAGGSPAIKF